VASDEIEVVLEGKLAVEDVAFGRGVLQAEVVVGGDPIARRHPEGGQKRLCGGRIEQAGFQYPHYL